MSIIKQYEKTIEFLGKTHPSTYEFFLFEIKDNKLKLRKQYPNTAEMEKDARRFASDALKNPVAEKDGYLCNAAVSHGNEHLVKISVQLIRDEDERIIAAICTLMKCTTYFKLQNMLNGVLNFATDNNPIKMDFRGLDEMEDSVITSPVSLDIIDNIMEEYVDDGKGYSSAEKTEIITDLYDSGVFELKGAVAKTAEALKCSEKSVYRYIKALKRARE